MAHHWWVLIAGGWQTLRSADGGCWHSSLYFLLPSDDGRRVSSESTAQLGGKLHKAESERGQREADPLVLHSAQVPGIGSGCYAGHERALLFLFVNHREQ